MTHPLMFDANDEILARVRDVCLSLPDAAEKVSHGRPTFFTKKVFAVYGGGTKGAQNVRHDQSLLLLPDPAEAPALAADPRFFVPAYYGPFGWIGLDLTAAAVDWDEVRELVEDSYRLTAPKRSIRMLDERSI